jgi:hypothetical protein
MQHQPTSTSLLDDYRPSGGTLTRTTQQRHHYDASNIPITVDTRSRKPLLDSCAFANIIEYIVTFDPLSTHHDKGIATAAGQLLYSSQPLLTVGMDGTGMMNKETLSPRVTWQVGDMVGSRVVANIQSRLGTLGLHGYEPGIQEPCGTHICVAADAIFETHGRREH